MRRRDFITALAGATAAWPVVVRAQPEPLRRVAIFMDLAEQDQEGQARVAAFRKGLQDLGWTEGRNVKFDTRWTAGDPALMRRYAAELVGLAPEVIMNGGLPTLVAMQQETRTIPVVFAQVLDPVGAGFVGSLARPGGNITGFVSFEYTMAGKWLETIKLMAPHIVRIAAIRDLASPSEMGMLGAIQAVIPAFAMPFVAIGGRDAAEFERAIEEFAREPNGGLIILPSPNTLVHRDQSWPWRPASACLRFTRTDFSRARADFYHTASFPPITFVARPPMLIASSKAQSRGRCRCKSRPNLNSC
jgi:putative tryptophan/tyrosine transport system substrate-binding protein